MISFFSISPIKNLVVSLPHNLHLLKLLELLFGLRKCRASPLPSMATKSFKLLCLENPLLDIQGVGYVQPELNSMALTPPSLSPTRKPYH